MVDEQDEFKALSQEISKILTANRKFLERVMDEDFEPEDEDASAPEEVFEEL
jgi:hypothetical protein